MAFHFNKVTHYKHYITNITLHYKHKYHYTYLLIRINKINKSQAQL